MWFNEGRRFGKSLSRRLSPLRFQTRNWRVEPDTTLFLRGEIRIWRLTVNAFTGWSIPHDLGCIDLDFCLSRSSTYMPIHMYIRPSRTCQTWHSGRAPGDEIFIINQGPTRDGPLCTLPKFCNTYLEQFSFFARPIRPNPTNCPNCFQFRRTWYNPWENGAIPSRSTTCAGATAT